MTKDTTQAGGFENGGLTAQFWNADPGQQINSYAYTTLRTSFKRNITTYDEYDKVLKSTFVFCLYLYAQGTINSELTDKSCEVVELSYHYPRMKMPTRSINFENYLQLSMLIGLLLLTMI